MVRVTSELDDAGGIETLISAFSDTRENN